MDVGRGAMDPQLQSNVDEQKAPDEDALVIEYKEKLYDGVITEAAKAGGVNTKQLNKRVGRKCQLKYAPAKQKAGKPSKVILEIIDDLQMMGVAKSALNQGMDVGNGGNRFDIFKVEINDPDALMTAISGPRKKIFSERVKKYKLKITFMNLGWRIQKNREMQQLLATIQ